MLELLQRFEETNGQEDGDDNDAEGLAARIANLDIGMSRLNARLRSEANDARYRLCRPGSPVAGTQ